MEDYNLGGYDKLSIKAHVGGGYGDIYGTKYARVEDESSPYYGKLILNTDGLPTSDGSSQFLGNQNPVAQLGWINSFTWKDLTASFQVDARIGGKMFSGTLGTMEYAGTAAWTVDNRDKMLVDGVQKDGDGYKVNPAKSIGSRSPAPPAPTWALPRRTCTMPPTCVCVTSPSPTPCRSASSPARTSSSP